jgi:predicted RNA-binding Zn-ribbon protein involved in translation (DUF1610 family)
MSEHSIEISIPTDNSGYLLLQCPLCGELFKLLPKQAEDDAVLEIRCPGCGLVSDNYLTEDVVELAMAKAGNVFLDELHKEMRKLEMQTKNSLVQVKAGKQPQHDPEPILMPSIDALTEKACENCVRRMKIAPALLFSVYTCPYCGESEFNER